MVLKTTGQFTLLFLRKYKLACCFLSELALYIKPLLLYSRCSQKISNHIRKEVLTMNSNLKKIVMTALFAALACVATMSIRIPTPGTGGYIHPGDAIVILAGIILGPVYGLLAGGIGSALSDLLGGYFVYVPITFVIKGLIALLSGLVYQKVAKDSKSRYIAVLLGGVIDIVLVAGGYFICEYFIYGSSAAASIPANIIQGVGGLIISFVLYPVLMAIPDVKQLTYENK